MLEDEEGNDDEHSYIYISRISNLTKALQK